MTITEAFECGLIPMEYEGVFPTHCYCGSEIQINDKLTKMWCPSEKCTNKQIARMSKMLNAFGVKDIGESYCRELWYGMMQCGLDTSHMNVFLLPFSYYPVNSDYSVTLRHYNEIQRVVKENAYSKGITLGELVSNMSLPGMNINARYLFEGFNNLDDMVKTIHRNFSGEGSMYRYISRKFGGGIQARTIFNTFKTFYKDIQIAESIFKVKKAGQGIIRVAITGRITEAGRYTRKEFLNYCNELCDGVAEVIDVDPGPSIHFVVADSASSSSTYEYGYRNGLLIDSVTFLNWLKSEVLE